MALIDAFNGYHMGITAENLAQASTRSPRRSGAICPAFPSSAQAAINAGRFQNEITPVMISPAQKADPVPSNTTSNPARWTSEGSLAGLPSGVQKGRQRHR